MGQVEIEETESWNAKLKRKAETESWIGNLKWKAESETWNGKLKWKAETYTLTHFLLICPLLRQERLHLFNAIANLDSNANFMVMNPSGSTQKERTNRRRVSFESEPSISDRRMGSFFACARTGIKRKSICVLWSGTRRFEDRFLRAAMWDQQGIMKGETEPMRRSRRSTTGLEWPKMWSSG